MEKVLQPAYFVPGSVKADNLFRNMKSQRTRFAIVLDEYGGMCGIVTMNDLIEQLVGDFSDGHHTKGETQVVRKLNEDTWQVSGQQELEGLAEQLNMWLPTEEYETFGGMVFGVLGSIPDDGVQFELNAYGLHIEVKNILDHRIEIATIQKISGSA